MSGPATADKAELKAPRGLSPLLAQSFPIAAAVVLVCGTALLALLTSGSNAPVMLTLLGLFAALGVFLMFGLIAGHIRIGERTTEIDLLQGVFEQIDQGTLITRGDGLIAYGNPASADLLGVKSASDLRLLEDAFSPDEDANAALFRLSRSVERNRARSEDIFVPARAGLGTGRWLRVSAKPFARAHVDTNLRGAALWTLTDITRDKSFEAQTRSNLERELDTFRGMPAGFFVAEASGRLTYANDQLCRWLGITWDEGDRELMLSDIASGDSASLIASIIERAGTDTQRVELDLVTDGGLAWPATLVLQTNEGATEHTASSVSAIVLPQVATHAAQITGAGHSTDALGGFFKSAPFGIATITAEGEIGGANTAFARLMVSSETAEGSDARRTFSRATTADGAADIHAALDEALAGRANIAPIEITVGDAGQFTRRLFFATTGRDDAEGRSAVVYVIDATEQKALEQKFAQSQKMEVVGKLAGGIAHDFNNVMTAIIGFSDLLLGTHRPGDPAFQHIRSIRTSAERAADLVRNLLAFSRQQQLSPKVLQVDDVIGDVLQMLRQTTLRDSIDLKINTARDLWLVEADKNELERVVVNLSVNARDAMPDGGRLTVRTRNVSERESQRMSKDGMTVGEYVLIEFEDTGTGIPADVLAKVFDPFFTT
ncbi:MAG: PAS domain-containing protein, partial [Pseudomonadota bacterium]